MRKIRVAAMPLLLLAALWALAGWRAELPQIAHFDFIWDVLLGGAVGAGFALLPQMASLGGKRNGLTGLFWVCGFVALVLVFYQYISLVTGVSAQGLGFLENPGTRTRMVEGAVLGYCSFVAGRGKL
jgi:hypothetical protein